MAVMNSACCMSMYVHFGNSPVDEYLCIHAYTDVHGHTHWQVITE